MDLFDPGPTMRGSGGMSSDRRPRALVRRRGRKRECVDGAEGGYGIGGAGATMEGLVTGAVLGPGDVDGRRTVRAGVTVALDAEGGTRPEAERVRTFGRRSRISTGLVGSAGGACVSSESDGMEDCDCPDGLEKTPPRTDHRRRRLFACSPVLALVKVE